MFSHKIWKLCNSLYIFHLRDNIFVIIKVYIILIINDKYHILLSKSRRREWWAEARKPLNKTISYYYSEKL